jgi:hypothetical protein
MIHGEGGDGDGTTPGDTDPGLVKFKPVLGGPLQAFDESQVAYSPCYTMCQRSHLYPTRARPR